MMDRALVVAGSVADTISPGLQEARGGLALRCRASLPPASTSWDPDQGSAGEGVCVCVCVCACVLNRRRLR